MVLRWRPGFTKGGISGERYPFYSRARTFAQFDALTKETFVSGITGGNRPKAIPQDLLYDAARGTVTFIDAETPPAAAPDGNEPADSDDDLSDAEEGVVSSSSADESDTEGEQHEPATPKQTVGFGRYLRRRSAVRAATAFVRKGLTADERAVLTAGLKTKRESAYVDVPDVLMMAAVVRHAGVRVPKSLAEAQRSPQWPQWLEALKKEYGGLISEGVFDEVDRSTVPEDTKVVPTQLLFNIKADGTFKCRIVVRGDLTVKGEHYLETKSPMVFLETIRMIVSLAAGSDMPLFSTDFSQAFLNADLDQPHLYCGLPTLPPEMRGGDFGMGGRTKVAHVH